jgi:ECF transporter S component (folate family)
MDRCLERLGDVLGAALFPVGPLDIRFTLIAALKGAIYGLFLHKAEISRYRIIAAQLLVTLVAHLLLNTMVISSIIGKGFVALLPLRIVKNFLFFPVELLVLMKMAEYRKSFERLAK